MTDTLEPLAVYAVRHEGWERLTEEQQEAIRQWATEQGISVRHAVRVEIHLLDCPFARVTEQDRDETGLRIIDEETGEIRLRAPFDVPVSSMPPVEPWPRR